MDIGLVLQGGGALGAYEWGSVSRLVEAGMRPVAITGVSIGAINTAVIAGAKGGDIVASLDALWKAITLRAVPFMPAQAQAELSLFGNPRFFRPRTDIWAMTRWPSFYSVDPMRDTLNEIVDFGRLNDLRLHKVAVTATRVRDGMGLSFANTEYRLDARHILASGSLPPGFPMTEIDGEFYIDGGVFSNTPLDQLLAMLDDSQLDTLPIFMLDLFPAKDATPSNILQIQNRMKEITYENRIEAEYGGATGLDAHGKMVRLLAEATKDNPELAKNQTVKAFLRQRAYANVNVIQAPHAPFSGDHDFSYDGVMQRYARGRDAAEAWLKASTRTTAPRRSRKAA
ncbi:MAG: patatin-like phospholipase family protein [Amaricoccus sp.]